jgi:hypothetical protein
MVGSCIECSLSWFVRRDEVVRDASSHFVEIRVYSVVIVSWCRDPIAKRRSPCIYAEFRVFIRDRSLHQSYSSIHSDKRDQGKQKGKKERYKRRKLRRS